MKSTDFFFSIRLHQFVIVKLRIALLFSIIDQSFGSFRPPSFSRSAIASRETRLFRFSFFSSFFSFFFLFFSFLFFSLLRIIRVRDEKSRTNASLSRRNDARGERDRRATLRLTARMHPGSTSPVLRTSSARIPRIPSALRTSVSRPRDRTMIAIDRIGAPGGRRVDARRGVVTLTLYFRF